MPSPPSLLDLPSGIFTRSGRSAILLGLQLLGFRPGDRVLVPTYHCPTMISPVVRLGGVPVFYPLDPDGEPDMAFLAAHGDSCSALLAAHFFGLPRDFSRLAAFCRARGIAFFEDCAHCFFGSIGQVVVGALGDFAIGSLPKFFPVREGGLLASAHLRISASLPDGGFGAELRSLWDSIDMASRAGRLGAVGALARGLARFRVRSGEGGNTVNASTPLVDEVSPALLAERSLADPLLEARGATRLERLLVKGTSGSSATRSRFHLYNTFRDSLADHSRIIAPIPSCKPGDAPYVVPLVVSDPDSVYASMRRAGIPVFRWDQVWPGTPVLAGDAGREWSRSLIQLVCHQALQEPEVEWICATARKIFDS